jgi:hypothetical protein
MSNAIIGKYFMMNQAKTLCLSDKKDIDLSDYLRLSSDLLFFLEIDFRNIKKIKPNFNNELLNKALNIIALFEGDILNVYYRNKYVPLIIETNLGWCICIAPLYFGDG